MRIYGYFETKTEVFAYKCLPISNDRRLEKFINMLKKKNKKMYVFSRAPYINPDIAQIDTGIYFPNNRNQENVNKHYIYLLGHHNNPDIKDKDYPIFDYGRGLFINTNLAEELGCEPRIEDNYFIANFYNNLKKQVEIYRQRCYLCKFHSLDKFSVCPRCRGCQRCYKDNPTIRACSWCHNGIKNLPPPKVSLETKNEGKSLGDGKYMVRV